jgi:hypothetical protein
MLLLATKFGTHRAIDLGVGTCQIFIQTCFDEWRRRLACEGGHSGHGHLSFPFFWEVTHLKRVCQKTDGHFCHINHEKHLASFSKNSHTLLRKADAFKTMITRKE